MQLTKTLFLLSLGFGTSLVAAACTSATDPTTPGSPVGSTTVPSASLTPRLDTPASAIACGDNVAWDGDASPDVRYGYTYNAAGELVHADGAYAAGGSDDSIDYSYDAAGNWTGYTETNGPDNSVADITAAYDGDGNLVDYAWAEAAPDYSDAWDYAMTAFIGPWQPTREVITEQGGAGFGYTLAYDASGRLVTATPDSGAPTTYSYDDTGLTITVDTGNGAFTGLVQYDADGNELYETWGGSDPSAIASRDLFAYSGDQLLSATYSSGSTAAPQVLQTLEVDTLRYDCSTASVRAHASHASSGKLVRPRVHAHR